MADIQIVAEVVGQKKINSLIKSTQTLEGRVKTLSKAYQSGKIGPEQYQQGLTELRKAASKLYPTHQKASAVVTKLSKDYLAASKAQKEYTAAQKQEQAATKAYIQARREATEANRRYDAQQRKAAQAAKQAADEEKRLKTQFDSNYRASQVYKRELRDLVKAKQRGIITTDRYQQEVQQLKAEFRDFGAQTKGVTALNNRFAAQTQMAGRRTNQLGVLMQQTGYQVGDFAVQVQSGTNVMVALGQQATQLVGTFGMLSKSTKMVGIFAGLGIAIPVVTALAGAFLRSSDNAKTFDDTLSDLESSISNYSSAVKEARANTKDLRERFGNVSETMRPFLADLEELEKLKALNNLNSAFEKLEVSSKTFMDGVREALVGNVQAVKDISDRLGLTVDQYKEISLLTQEIKDAETSSDRMSAVNAVRDSLKETFGSLDNMTEEMQSFYLSLVKVVIAGGELKGETQKAADAVKGLNELLEKGRQAQLERNRANMAAIRDKEQELALAQKINKYGEDSVEVVKMRAKQEAIAKNLTEENQQKYIDLAVEIFKVQQATEKTADVAGRIDFTGAISSANGLLGVLGRISGVIGGILGQIGSIGFENVGKQAQVRALEAGKTAGQATIEGRLAEERAKLESGVLGQAGVAGEIAINAQLLAKRKQMEQGLGLDERIKALTAEGTSSGGGGGGGGMSAAEKQAQEFEKLKRSLDDAYASQQKFNEGKAVLDKALKSGLIPTTEEYKRLLGLLREEYDLTTDKGDNFAEDMAKIAQKAKDAMGDAFMSIVDGSKSAGDAFKDMARIILKQAFELLVVKPIMDGLFGQNPSENGIGGLIGSILGQKNGGAWNNGVQMYANGGVVTAPTGFQHSGGLGVMGEAGPEAIMPLKRGKNGKLGVQVEGGNQGNVTVQNHFHIAANGDDSVKRIIAQEAPKIANLTQKQILDQRARGGAFRTTFG